MANGKRKKANGRRTVSVLSGPIGVGLFKILRALPPSISSRLMEGLVGHFRSLVIKSQTVSRNFSIAMPELTEHQLQELVRQAARNFGRVLGELPHLRCFQKNSRGVSMSLHNAPSPELVAATPIIFIGAHFSNWEVVGAACAMLDRPVAIIYSSFGETVADREMTRMRSASGPQMVERQLAVREGFRALAQGKNLGMLVDHRVDSGHDVPFFGRVATFPHLPARLALRFGCPIVPVSAKRLGRVSYEVRFGDPMYFNKDLSSEEAEWELTARMAAAIEAVIRENPGDWFCAIRRWPKDMV